MKTKRHVKLSPAEAKRLEQFSDKRGGQIPAAAFFGVAPATLSRNVNRHTAPSQMLRAKLIENGIVKPQNP